LQEGHWLYVTISLTGGKESKVSVKNPNGGAANDFFINFQTR
jgi:hypothetical protein